MVDKWFLGHCFKDLLVVPDLYFWMAPKDLLNFHLPGLAAWITRLELPLRMKSNGSLKFFFLDNWTTLGKPKDTILHL